MLKTHIPNQYLLFRILFLTSMIFGMAFGLSTCNTKPEETDLPFETIEQKEWAGTGKSYEAREPGLMVISQSEETDNLGIITDEAVQKLQVLDYGDYFAFVAFQGWKPNGGYSIQVNRVSRIGNSVNIYAQFHEPRPDEEKTDEITSPYHLMIVQKTGNWGQEVTFNLLDGETVVVSLSHFIP